MASPDESELIGSEEDFGRHEHELIGSEEDFGRHEDESEEVESDSDFAHRYGGISEDEIPDDYWRFTS